MARMSLRTFYPGSDVRGLAHYGAVASSSSSPAELQARMQGLITRLRQQYDAMRAQLPADTAGLQTIGNTISLKEKSMGDVLGGQLTLEKWLNGVEVLRAEMVNFASYVKNNASIKYELAKLGDDLKETAVDYSTAFVSGAKKGLAIAGGSALLLVGIAGVLLWKVGLPLLKIYLGAPRHTMAGFGRARRARARRRAW